MNDLIFPIDAQLSYPRVCSHRGFNTVAPENTMPAFASAVALGTDEIELDLWPTKDGEIIVCHDRTVDRVTDGHGKIVELSYDEISRMDAGVKFSEHYRGLHLALFEEVLKQFAKKVIINIHIKSLDSVRKHSPAMKQRSAELGEKYKSGVLVNISDNKEMNIMEEEIWLDEEQGIEEYDHAVFEKIVSS